MLDKPHSKEKYATVGALAGLMIAGGLSLMTGVGAIAVLTMTVGTMIGGAFGYSEAAHKNRMHFYKNSIQKPKPFL